MDIYVPDGQSSLGHIAFKAGWLPIFDEQIFAPRIPVFDSKHRGAGFNLGRIIGCWADDSWHYPAQPHLAPGTHVRRMELRAIKSPGVRHQAVRADARTGVVRVVQIGQSEGVADLVAD